MKSLFNKKVKCSKCSGKPAPIRLALALQGGGAYGSYTRGVLKALLESGLFEQDNFELKAVTGTSAGAMNGAVLVYGLNAETPEKTANLLDKYWEQIGRKWSAGNVTPFHRGYPNIPSLQLTFMKSASIFVQKGAAVGMLRNYLTNTVKSFKKLREGPVKLFVNATRENPATGERDHYVFKDNELTADTIVLSGNLEEFGPAAYKGHNYYDGAYWRNPCLEDIMAEDITDLMVITLQKKPGRAPVPKDQDKAREERHSKPGHELITEEIHDHIEFIHKEEPRLNLHVISLDVAPDWDETSRMNGNPQWLDILAQKGYQDGLNWLSQNREKLGICSSYKTDKYECPHVKCPLPEQTRKACKP